MPDPQDQPDHRPDGAAEPTPPSEPTPSAPPPAKKAAAKKAAKKAPAKKAAKKSPAKKAGPAKKPPVKAAPPAGVNGSRQGTDGAREAAARAKSTVEGATNAVGAANTIGAPAAGSSVRSPVVVLTATAVGLLAVFFIRRLRRRSA